MSPTRKNQKIVHLPSARQTGRNILAIWVNRAFAIIIPIILTPIITNHFGLGLTGIWLMITQLSAHLMLLDAGLINSLVRYLAGQRAIDNSKKASSYLSTAFFSLLCISILLLVVSPLIAKSFLPLLDTDNYRESGAGTLVLLTIIFVAISLPLRVGQGMVASIHRFDVAQLWDLFSGAVRLLILLLMFTFYDPSLVQLGSVVYVVTILSAFAIFISGLKMNKDISIRRSSVTLAALVDLSSMGGAAILVSVSSVLLLQTPSMVTGYLIGPDSVLMIAIPIMIYGSITPFMSTLPLIIAPIAAGISATGEKKDLLEIFTIASRYHSTVALIIFLIIIAAGSALIDLWLSGPKIGNEEIRTMSLGASILFAGFTVSSIAQLGRSILTSAGKHWAVASIELVTALSGIMIGLYLIKVTNYGVLGMLAGICMALIVRSILCYPLLLGRHFSINPSSIIVRCLGLPIFVAGTSALAGIFAILISAHYSLMNENTGYIIASSLSILLWSVLTWILIVPEAHKTLFRVFIIKKLHLSKCR